ncbi:hypothetical protein IKD60_02480 [Candidatus Saccharibacteria bacterium]|nr:hypothetical protein [Candidatus Saccharibacteria bacterium]
MVVAKKKNIRKLVLIGISLIACLVLVFLYLEGRLEGRTFIASFSAGMFFISGVLCTYVFTTDPIRAKTIPVAEVAKEKPAPTEKPVLGKKEEEAIRQNLRSNMICADCARRNGCSILKIAEDEVIERTIANGGKLAENVEFFEIILDRCTNYKKK